MASKPLTLTTPRDIGLLSALERSPLTVEQLLKLSATFAYPFTTDRRVQERLQRLVAAGRVRRWLYATAGRGALSYYTLSPLGFRLMHGEDTLLPSRFRFGPVGIARQAHVRALAEAIVHLLVAAHRSSVAVQNFRPENALHLRIGVESLFPDGAFDVVMPDRTFHYFVELDNCTETIHGAQHVESWQKKIAFYERLQDTVKERFRVLAVTTGEGKRLANILKCAASLARNPRRCTVYGTSLVDLLAEDKPLTQSCFLNHTGKRVALLPSLASARIEPPVPAVVTSMACREPLPQVWPSH